MKAELTGAGYRPSSASHGGLRDRERAWCRDHADALRAFCGEWVILEGEQVVGHGRDPSPLIAEAKRQGIKIPYIFFVREPDDNVATLGL